MKYDANKFVEIVHSVRNKNNKDMFFTFFDGGGTANGSFERAADIFKNSILPYAEEYLVRLSDKTSLDIGYGGGGQIAEAAKYFKTAQGIDVHREQDYVEAELKNRSCFNYDLKVCDGSSIPFCDNSIDFVHSFVTFIHVMDIQIVKSYLSEIKRVLKPKGIAVLFFARALRTGTSQTHQEYLKDTKREEKDGIDYFELDEAVRKNIWLTNLRISMCYMKSLASKANLTVIKHGGSHVTLNDGSTVYGGQHFIVLRNKAIKFRVDRKRASENENRI